MAPHLGKEYGAQSENWHAPDAFVLKYQRKGLDAALSRLYGMIDFMDFQVGRMLAAVDRLGLGENTVVAFFSDNGPIDGGRLSTIERDGRNLYNLNGNKGEIFDNGIRVPLFVRWQGHFPPSVVEDALVSITDIFPTMMDLSGARNRTYGKPIDGWSLSKLLYNPKVVSESWKQRVLFHTSGAPEWTRRGGVYVPLPDLGRNKADLVLGRDGRWAVREGRYKLVHFFGREEVFDMIQDPQESSPLDNPILHQHLRNKLGEWWLKMLVDPGSFTTPVFHIGWPGRSTSKVLAMAAVQTSPRVFLHSHDASGWVEEGTFAVYQVNILTTGSYIVRVRVQSTHPIGGVVRVSCDDGRKSSVAGWIMANGYLGVISLQRGGGQCYMEFKIATSTGGAGLYGGRARMESIDFDLLQEN
ncbi:hypothetical protein BSKO_05368 [Bryopsis sp. KO-2023]|nr:hypothetical protein BSKO_05368 [Bryopsis sp. KO-2023]